MLLLPLLPGVRLSLHRRLLLRGGVSLGRLLRGQRPAGIGARRCRRGGLLSGALDRTAIAAIAAREGCDGDKHNELESHARSYFDSLLAWLFVSLLGLVALEEDEEEGA
jgi:hypothetical protein